eukprot:GHVU01095870.1.p1 GENE.GHVU01095870.1~~GHVU01095870.1.p1  ORF type:complete len:118 (-),score=7.61 GHVU01095870.1:1-354(-)
MSPSDRRWLQIYLISSCLKLTTYTMSFRGIQRILYFSLCLHFPGTEPPDIDGPHVINVTGGELVQFTVTSNGTSVVNINYKIPLDANFTIIEGTDTQTVGSFEWLPDLYMDASVNMS